MDVEALTREDLGQVIGEIRAKFEKMALKNQEELKASHVVKVSEVEAEVAENTTALQVAQTERKEKHRLMQSLEIDIHFQKSQVPHFSTLNTIYYSTQRLHTLPLTLTPGLLCEE